MPDNMHDSYEIELKLKSNWSAQLEKQSRQFEGFIKKANRSAVSLEKSITGMHTNLSKTYGSMFSGSQKQMESMVGFAKKSLTDVSASTIKIMQQVHSSQDKVDQLITRNIAKIKEYQKVASSKRLQAEKKGPLSDALKGQADRLDKISAVLENQVAKMSKFQAEKVSQMLGKHFRMLGENILKESKLVSTGTKELVDNAIAQWKKVKSLGFMDTATSAVKKAGGLADMVTKRKQVYANLEQLRKSYLAQVKVFQEHEALAARATSQKVKQYHQESAFFAVKNLEKINAEHKKASVSARMFTETIKEQRKELSKTGGIRDLKKGWNQQLKVSNVKALMEPIIANIEKSGELAGKGFLGNLVKNIKQGDKLRVALTLLKIK